MNVYTGTSVHKKIAQVLHTSNTSPAGTALGYTMVSKRYPKIRSLLLLAVLLAAPFAAMAADPAEGDIVDADDSADDYEDPEENDRAHLLVRKSKGEGNTVVGSNLTLTVELYNAGKRYAASKKHHAAHHPLSPARPSLSLSRTRWQLASSYLKVPCPTSLPPSPLGAPSPFPMLWQPPHPVWVTCLLSKSHMSHLTTTASWCVDLLRARSSGAVTIITTVALSTQATSSIPKPVRVLTVVENIITHALLVVCGAAPASQCFQ